MAVVDLGSGSSFGRFCRRSRKRLVGLRRRIARLVSRLVDLWLELLA